MSAIARRACRGASLALLALGLLTAGTGCFEQRTRVIVYPDGSGRIVVTRVFLPAAVHLTEMQSTSMGMAAVVRADDAFFSEAQLKRDAKRLFGKGVRFVSAQRLEHNGARGSVAVYAFDKVDGLALAPEMLFESPMNGVRAVEEPDEEENEEEAQTAEAAPEAGAEDENAEGEDAGMGNPVYRFAFTPGPQSKLTVRIPAAFQPKAAEEADNEGADEREEMMASQLENMPDEARAQLMGNGNPFQLTGNETSAQLMEKICKGMRISLEVEVRGAPVTMAASHPDAGQAGRCTLLALDGDTLMRAKGPAAMMGLERGMGSMTGLLGKPGVTVETRKQVTFTFVPPAAH